jgi:hypothetical protein
MNSSAAIDPKPARGFQGLIHGATLADLVQMECLGMTTRTVRIDGAEQSGRIFFASGQVVHAEVGELRGDAAFTELIGWQDGSFTIEEGVRPYAETITRHWQSLLLAAAHHQDESIDPIPKTQFNPTPIMQSINDPAVAEVFGDSEVQSAVFFTEDGTLVEGKGPTQEDLHATFSYVVQLTRLIGESLGAENLQEIQIAAPDYRGLCVIREAGTAVVLTTAKGNINALAKKLN